MNFLESYDNDPEYRKFKIDLENFDLSAEFNVSEDIVSRKNNSTISIILNAVGASIHEARPVNDKVELTFYLHRSVTTVETLQTLVRSLGNSVGVSAYDLSNTIIFEQ